MFTIVGVVRSMPLYPLWKQYQSWCKDYHQLWYSGAVGNLSGLIEPTGFVDRDMDVRPLGFELGQTPFEEGIRIGHKGIIVGSGDTFATSTPEIKCDLVDMEAYAIARVCKKYDIEFKCLKYVTDNADESSAKSWEENIATGSVLFQEWLKSNDYMPLQKAHIKCRLLDCIHYNKYIQTEDL